MPQTCAPASIGKDSSVLLHLAKKTFFPASLPFPLLHVDTTWKFREMYAFRDAVALQPGVELVVRRILRRSTSASALHSWLGAPHGALEDRMTEAGSRNARVRRRDRRRKTWAKSGSGPRSAPSPPFGAPPLGTRLHRRRPDPQGGEVCGLMAQAGLVVTAAFIFPFRAERRVVRDLFDHSTFFEIFVDAPLEVAAARDPKGL